MSVVRTLRVRVDRVQFPASRQNNITKGPIVKWYYGAFALHRREFDSRWVHKFVCVVADDKVVSIEPFCYNKATYQ